ASNTLSVTVESVDRYRNNPRPLKMLPEITAYLYDVSATEKSPCVLAGEAKGLPIISRRGPPWPPVASPLVCWSTPGDAKWLPIIVNELTLRCIPTSDRAQLMNVLPIILTRSTWVASVLPNSRMQSPLRKPGRLGWTNRMRSTLTSTIGMEQVPLAVVQTPLPISMACVCSSVLVMPDVSITKSRSRISLAPGSIEITLVVAAPWSPPMLSTVLGPSPEISTCWPWVERAAKWL